MCMAKHLRRWKHNYRLEIIAKWRQMSSRLTDKEIYDYLKNHHVFMKCHSLFKKLVAKKSSSFLFSLSSWNGRKKTRRWYTVRNLREVYESFVPSSMKKIRIEAYSLKKLFEISENLRRLESMPKQNITMKT